MKIKAPRDFWAGLMFVVFGTAFVVVARNYQMGTAVRMGPAYFPTMLGGILIALGAIILLISFFTSGSPVPRIYLKPNFYVLGAVVLFAMLLKPLGLVLATAVLIAVSAYGGFEFRIKEVVILAVVLAAFATLVFVKGLGLPLPVWPGE